MHMVWVFCLFSMVLYVSINISEALDIRAGNDVIKEHHFKYRQKRAIAAIMRGVRALKYLLIGTWRDVKHSDDLRTVYEKMGNYRQALADFLAVNPTDIKFLQTRDGKSIKVGNIGNRRLVLREDEIQGKPILDIIHRTEAGVDHIDTIRYVK